MLLDFSRALQRAEIEEERHQVREELVALQEGVIDGEFEDDD